MPDLVIVNLGEQLSEKELCPDELLAGQEAAFANDIAWLQTRRPEFVFVSCPACEGGANSWALEKTGFEFVTCSDCGTLYMNPRPTESIMAEYYANSQNYQYWAKHIYPASESARKNKVQKPWLDRVVSYCDNFDMPRGTLMEVGAGFGTFSSAAAESGAFRRVIAVEPTPDLAKACRSRGLEVIEKRIEAITRTDVDAVDALASFEVIEHLFEPCRFIAKAHEILRPGGLLVLSCPNGEGFDIQALGALSLAVDAQHVNLFNPRSLGALVERQGFEVLSVTTPGRLDAEFVHEAVLKNHFDVTRNPLFRRIFLTEWDRLGWPFQQFLAENGLSSHMWLAARRR